MGSHSTMEALPSTRSLPQTTNSTLNSMSRDTWEICTQPSAEERNDNAPKSTVILRSDVPGNFAPKRARKETPFVNMDTVRICSPPWEWCMPPAWNKMPWVGISVKMILENLEDKHLVGNDLVVKGSRFVEGETYIQVESETDLQSHHMASQRVWVQYEHIVEARTGLRLLVFQRMV
ncbi:hypothetical protein CPB85DRAFT_1459119 [Mucidula mucida]|nr:hypothetical protein CPB85DRAFT_1459119 [Mucidula mucida]